MLTNIKFYQRDVGSHRHPKFIILRNKYGWEGDARFWALNDLIGEAEECLLDYSEKRQKMQLVAVLGFSTVAELEEFIDYLVSDECALITQIEPYVITTDRVQEALSLTMKGRESTAARVARYRANKKAKEGAKSASEQPAVPLVPAINYSKVYKELPVKDKASIMEFLKSRPPIIEPYADLWNIWATERGKPLVQKCTTDRKNKLKARLQEESFDFVKILAMAKDGAMILEGTWFTFDWVLFSEKNYTKVLEGNYPSAKGASVEKCPMGNTINRKKHPDFPAEYPYTATNIYAYETNAKGGQQIKYKTKDEHTQ